MKEIACIAVVCVLAGLLMNFKSEAFWLRSIEATKAAQDEDSEEHVRENIEKVYNEIPPMKETLQEWEARKAKEAEESKRAMFVH